MIEHNLTDHVRWRMKKRSIRNADLHLLLTECDIDVPQRGAASAISLSRYAVADATSRGVDRDMLRRAARLTAIVAEDGAVITAYRNDTRVKPKRRLRTRSPARSYS